MSKRKPGKQGAPTKASTPSKASGPMDVGLLEQLVQLMSANDLNTVDLRDGEKRVVLKRGTPVVHYTGNPTMPAGSQYAPGGAAAAPQSATGSTEASAEALEAAADAKLVPIKSPMVGTFYAASKQGEKAFVSVGSSVNEESDVCIVEAMKVFNVLKAETNGTIAKVMIQDGQPVEHGTVLFLVKPA